MRLVSTVFALICLASATTPRAQALSNQYQTIPQSRPGCMSQMLGILSSTKDAPTLPRVAPESRGHSSTPAQAGADAIAMYRDTTVSREFGTSAPLPRCCKLLTIQQVLSWAKRTTGRLWGRSPQDVYYSGAKLHESEVPEGYSNRPPRKLQVDTTDILPETVTFSDKSAAEILETYRTQLGPDAQVTQIGKGATSVVYTVHEELPFGQRSALGALARGIEAIKIRSARIFDEINLEKSARYFRNDLARYKLARELVKHFTYKGMHLLEVAEITSTREEHSRGILRQKLVDGPSLDQIQNHLDVVLMRKKSSRKEQEASARFLRETGIATPNNNPQLEFLEIQSENNAIENFFRDSHPIVSDFIRDNKLENYGGIPKGKKMETDSVAVGFDFNHGQNVFWDRRARVFRMVDF